MHCLSLLYDKQCNFIASHIAYHKHQSAIHWNYIAYDKHGLSNASKLNRL